MRSPENRLMRLILSMLCWYVFGFLVLWFLTYYVLPLRPSFAHFWGYFIDIIIFIVLLTDLLEINSLTKKYKITFKITIRLSKRLLKYYDKDDY
ncbi:MAG: hypothetical protein ACFFDF_23025 [Candidatus Odinarchaeota archaeon]